MNTVTNGKGIEAVMILILIGFIVLLTFSVLPLMVKITDALKPIMGM